MAAFPRTIRPARPGQIMHPAPLVSTTQGNKVQVRQTSAVGVTWTEEYAVIQTQTAAGLFLISEIGRLWSSGTNFTITHEDYLTALGTIATGSTGQVNGAGQTGASLAVDNITPTSGTVLKGSYLTVAGLRHAVWLTADVTVAGGAATFPIFPSISSGDAPGDGNTVTVNGPMTCKFAVTPEIPQALTGLRYYAGLRLTFTEDVS